MTGTLSVSSPAPYSTMQSPPQKDYAAAFGALQSQYGIAGGLPGAFLSPIPSLPETSTNTRKWYKWGSRSSSTTSLVRPATRSSATSPTSQRAVRAETEGTLTESELRFGKLMAEYGLGPVSQAAFSRK